MPPANRHARRFAAAGLGLYALFFTAAAAAEPPQRGALPEPLTLEYALSLANEPHPELEAAEARLHGARAATDLARSAYGWRADVEGRLRWIEPSPIAPDQSSADHRLGLVVQKILYDFGRTSNAVAAGEQDVRSRELLLESTRRQRRLAIMQAYFDVLLADLKFMRDNEEMAVVYVNLDRLRDRHELGEISDIDLLKAETDYQRIRGQRAASENRQRITRARLAQTLGRPGQLPSDLATPDLNLPDKLPELDPLQKQAAADNLVLRALRAGLLAAQERVAAAAAGSRPVLRGRAETFAYARRLGSSDDWRAGVTLDVPLSTGGAVDAAVAAEKAKLYGLRADLEQAQMDVQQSVLESWMKLDNLRLQREEAQAVTDYRELYLDRSRALYEMEARADLGDAMVRTSEAQLESARARYESALTWAKLRMLAGDVPGISSAKDSAAQPAAPQPSEQEQNGS